MTRKAEKRSVKTYKFKGQSDANGNRAIFTRIPEKLFAIIEAQAKREKRSMSQQAALILEEYALLGEERRKFQERQGGQSSQASNNAPAGR